MVQSRVHSRRNAFSALDLPARPAAAVATFARDERGATAIEYALIASLIAVVIIGAVTSLGTSVGNLFNTTANAVN